MGSLKVKKLSYSYEKQDVIKDISFELSSGVNVLIGPNAAGKTTLIKCLARILKPQGEIFYNKRSIKNQQEVFELLSYLPQNNNSTAALTTLEVILLGRLQSLSLKVRSQDLNKVKRVMTDLHISHLAERKIAELSGGQQQIVFIAQAIIKQPKILLLDEPTNNLDLKNSFETLELIQKITKKNNICTLIALHDLNFAAKYAEELIVLNKGRIKTMGSVDDVLTKELLREVYGVEAEIIKQDNNLNIIVKGT